MTKVTFQGWFDDIIGNMKLRMRGNSIRLRLTRSEAAQFAETGSVTETIEFGVMEPELSYQLLAARDGAMMSAQFIDNNLRVWIPKNDAENWINSDQVGIEASQELGKDKILRILVEKDFACLSERTGEDESDAFPNPFISETLELGC